MKAIYEFSLLTAYWTGNKKEIDDADGMMAGWTDCPLPEIPSGWFARWNIDGWILTQDPAPIVPPPVEPVEPVSDQRPPNIIA